MKRESRGSVVRPMGLERVEWRCAVRREIFASVSGSRGRVERVLWRVRVIR